VLQDLNSLVVNPDPSWTLQTATGINDAGQIVGYGINSSGQYHAFLLNPLPLGSVQAASTVQTSLPTYGAIPAPEGDQDSLIVVTHGWINPGWPSYENPQVTIDSVNSMSNSIQQYLIANNLLNKWKVYGYMWQDEASLTLLQGGPSRAIHNAHQQGNIVGESIVQDGWKHVHFIGHSAGAGLIQSATEEIKATSTLSPPVVIHETFLDAYDGAALEFVSEYGYKADWADSYFSRDLETGEATQQPLLWAYNADVTTLDPNASQEKVPGFVSGGDLNSPCYKTESTHGWPIDFYDNTITGNVNINYGMFGFPLSEEMGVSLSSLASQYVVGNGFSGGGSVEILGPPDPTCSLAGVITPSYMNTGTSFPASSTIQSTTGTIQEFLNSLKLITGSPVWVATVITDTNALNTLSFDAEFTSASGADGLLSVYWDTNMIGLVDEAAVQSGLQHYTLPFPNSATNTSHILGFHMDPFTSVHSSITITNIAMGFVGVQPPVLSVTTNKSNGLFVYQLTGQPDSYTIQANSDLTTTNWVNIALLGNTTGAVNFVDQNSTNYPIRFYRAVGQ
jgi:probable HAF family extracellular repeat protein